MEPDQAIRVTVDERMRSKDKVSDETDGAADEKKNVFYD